MTTEQDKGFVVTDAANLFESNDCLNLPWPGNVKNSLQLACVTVSRRVEPEQRDELMWACVEYAWRLFLCSIEEWTCWLFACVCGEDNRITRHRGLWRLLVQQGVPLADHASSERALVMADGTLCFYGVTTIETGKMATLRSVVGPGSRSFLALLPRAQTPVLDSTIATGWQRGLSSLEELRDIALVVSQQEGVLLRLFGEFDDRETGVDCIMGENVYRTAIARMQGGATA